METAMIKTPLGFLAVSAVETGVVSIDFAPEPSAELVPAHPLLESACHQLSRYFDDPAAGFTLPLSLPASGYRRRVWAALLQIPPGRTETYGALAARIASGPRAVAGACRANPLPIIIPCHRIVSAHGLGGYCGRDSGPAMDIKRWLLRHEGSLSG